MRKLWSIFEKELKLLLRDPGGLLMLFVLPAFFILILSLALQGALSSETSAEKADILFVVEDDGDLGPKLMQAIEDNSNFRAVTEVGGRPPSRAEAMELLGRGAYKIAVVVPAGATRAAGFDDDATVEVLVEPTVNQRVALAVKDAIRGYVHVSIIGRVRDAAWGCLAALPPPPVCESDPGRDGTLVVWSSLDPSFDGFRGSAGLSVEQRYVKGGGAQMYPNSVQQNVPGWTIFALFWIAQILSINIINERMSGSYKRVRIAPTSLVTYVFGKSLPFLFINVAQAVVMFAIGVHVLPLFGAPRLEITDYQAMAVLTVATSCVAVSFGLLMGALSRTSAVAASISASVLIIMCVVGGIMVPKFMMPALMQKAALFVPHGWALDGYLNVLINGQTTADVLPTVGVLLGFAAGFFVLAVLRLRQLARSG